MKKVRSLLTKFKTSKKRGGKNNKDLVQSTKVFWFVGISLLIIVALIAATILTKVKQITPDVENGFLQLGIPNNEQSDRHPLTGEFIEEPYDVLPQVFGVMVENAADAWPLVGIDEAFLVIEAPVEGSIPRFITFFSEESTVDKIGPVRSARPYYVDWNDELDAVYAHVGGSPEALDHIKYDYDTIDLNQFFQSEYFYRQEIGRYAPHNVYSDADKLISALDELELDEPNYTSWRFKDDSPIEEGAVSVKIDWGSGSTYDVEWVYDAETNSYTRKQGRSIMKLEGGATVEANNIVIMGMDIRTIDNVGRKSIDTTKGGNAYFVMDGEMFPGQWIKDERTDRLRFETFAGDEITLNAGTTWIEIVHELDIFDDDGPITTTEVE